MKWFIGILILLFACSAPTEPEVEYIDTNNEKIGAWAVDIGSINNDGKYRLWVQVKIVQFGEYGDALLTMYIYLSSEFSESGKAELVETATRKIPAAQFEATGEYIAVVESVNLYDRVDVLEVSPAIDVR
jgi:hypothetical protein